VKANPQAMCRPNHSYVGAGRDYVLETVGVTNRFFVEFGFPEKQLVREVVYNCSSSNTFHLRQQNWAGLLLDLDVAYRPLNLRKEAVHSRNILSLFKKYAVPREPDFVSIDIDSHDVWILDAMLKAYRPRVIQVEYNANYGMTGAHAIAFPDKFAGMAVRNGADHFDGGRCYMSSSAAALLIVATRHGYMLTDGSLRSINEHDLFFARADVWPKPPVTLRQMWSRHQPTSGCVHKPMFATEATNLVDLGVIMDGGDVCTARRCAAQVLRHMAQAKSAHHCNSCFGKLAKLERVAGWNANCTDANGAPSNFTCTSSTLADTNRRSEAAAGGTVAAQSGVPLMSSWVGVP